MGIKFGELFKLLVCLIMAAGLMIAVIYSAVFINRLLGGKVFDAALLAAGMIWVVVGVGGWKIYREVFGGTLFK